MTSSLVIRDEQMRALEAETHRLFVEQMCVHLRRRFSDECAAMTHAQLVAHVEFTVSAAAKWRLVSPSDVCRFLNLTMIYGAGFDTQPAQRWMRDMLSDTRMAAPGARLLAVYGEALRRLRTAKNAEVR